MADLPKGKTWAQRVFWPRFWLVVAWVLLMAAPFFVFHATWYEVLTHTANLLVVWVVWERIE